MQTVMYMLNIKLIMNTQPAIQIHNMNKYFWISIKWYLESNHLSITVWIFGIIITDTEKYNVMAQE